MFKKFSSSILLTLVLVMFASPVLAAWNSSTITLPRNGWWNSVDRAASGPTQQAKVTNPSYDVVSNVSNNSGTKLSSNKTHSSGKNTTVKHSSGAKKEDTLKGSFRSSVVNQKTNKVNLAWNP